MKKVLATYLLRCLLYYSSRSEDHPARTASVRTMNMVASCITKVYCTRIYCTCQYTNMDNVLATYLLRCLLYCSSRSEDHPREDRFRADHAITWSLDERWPDDDAGAVPPREDAL